MKVVDTRNMSQEQVNEATQEYAKTGTSKYAQDSMAKKAKDEKMKQEKETQAKQKQEKTRQSQAQNKFLEDMLGANGEEPDLDDMQGLSRMLGDMLGDMDPEQMEAMGEMLGEDGIEEMRPEMEKLLGSLGMDGETFTEALMTAEEEEISKLPDGPAKREKTEALMKEKARLQTEKEEDHGRAA